MQMVKLKLNLITQENPHPITTIIRTANHSLTRKENQILVTLNHFLFWKESFHRL